MIFLFCFCVTLWFMWSIYSYFAYRRISIVGKTVLITGGGSDIGKCLTMRFLRLGAKVIVWDNSKERLDHLLHETFEPGSQRKKKELDKGDSDNELLNVDVSESGTGLDLTTKVVDFSSRLQVQRAAKQLGPVHIIVNAADLHPSRDFFDRSDESSEKIMANNALCPLVLARVLLPSMLQRRDGHFVTITHAAGMMGVAKHPDYAASHWAAVGAHESLQMLIKEMGGSGNVRTTLFCPYSILRSSSTTLTSAPTRSDNSDSGETTQGTSAKSITRMFSCTQLSFTPEDIANSCVWAVCYGVERVYMPIVLLFLPLLRVLPVPWFLFILSPAYRGSRRSAAEA